MSQKKLSEYIEALDGITYPQWQKLCAGVEMQFEEEKEKQEKDLKVSSNEIFRRIRSHYGTVSFKE